MEVVESIHQVIPNMENRPRDLNIPKEVEYFARSLFLKLCESTRREYLIFEKVIPFSFIWSFFSFYRIGKKDAKKIIKIWKEIGLCEIAKVHGIRIPREVSDKIVLELAKQDTSFWLLCAPHQLNKKEGEENGSK